MSGTLRTWKITVRADGTSRASGPATSPPPGSPLIGLEWEQASEISVVALEDFEALQDRCRSLEVQAARSSAREAVLRSRAGEAA